MSLFSQKRKRSIPDLETRIPSDGAVANPLEHTGYVAIDSAQQEDTISKRPKKAPETTQTTANSPPYTSSSLLSLSLISDRGQPSAHRRLLAHSAGWLALAWPALLPAHRHFVWNIQDFGPFFLMIPPLHPIVATPTASLTMATHG